MPTFTSLNSAMFRAAVVDGATSGTNIPVESLATDDVLLVVLQQDSEGPILADLSEETFISSTGNIQLRSTSTAGDTLIVLWLDVSQAEN